MKRSRKNNSPSRREKSRSPVKTKSHRENRSSRWSPVAETSSITNVSNTEFKESISIEETNKLRAKLGLAPLKSDPVTSSGDTETDRLNSFVHAPAKNLTEINKQNRLKEKLTVQKNKREALEVLREVKSIISNEDVSTMSWIGQMKEKKKEIEESRIRANRFEEMDEIFLGNSAFLQDYNSSKGNYSSDDLQGLKIQHKLDRFQEGQSTILTLRDANVLDEDEGDVLVNVNALDEERAIENVKNRRAQKKLGGIYADEDEDVINGYRVKGILEKYDTEIEGDKKDFLVIGEKGKYLAHHEMAMAKLENELKRTVQSLGDTNFKVANEYLSEQEIAAKFKKRKRKVKVIRKIDKDQFQPKTKTKDTIKEEEEFDENGLPKKISEVISLCSSSSSSKKVELKPLESSSDDDEDDLRNELEKTINKVKISHHVNIKAPEEIIERYTSTTSHEEEIPESKGIEFDYTEEFYKNISARFKEKNETRLNMAKTKTSRRSKIKKDSDAENSDSSDEEAMKISASQLSSDESELDDGEIREDKLKDSAGPLSGGGGDHVLNDEPQIGKGCVSVLQLARQKGYLDKEDPKETGTVILTSKTISAKNYVVEDRYGQEALEAKFTKRDRANGPLTEFKDMKDYKPSVRLEYTDEYGREMDKKEAFRVLSHKFHGRTSGKKKTEKKLKKIKEEMILKGTMLSDTPLNTAEKLNKKLAQDKVPFVVLSGKNVISKSIMK